MEYFFSLCINGIGIGMIYGLIALGFVLIYKATAVFNFAQGEMVMMCSYFGYSALKLIRIPALALPISLFAGMLLFYITQQLFLRPLIGKPLFPMMIMTIGLGVFYRALALAIWKPYPLGYPTFLPDEPVGIFGVNIAWSTIFATVSGILILLCFGFYFFFTKQGLALRTACEDHLIAQSLGVRISTVFALAWLIGGLAATLGGIALGTMIGASLEIATLMIKAFAAVLFGGMESLLGAVIAGLVIGVCENLAGGYVDPLVGGGFKELMPFIIMILTLMFRPYGLFGLRKVERV